MPKSAVFTARTANTGAGVSGSSSNCDTPSSEIAVNDFTLAAAWYLRVIYHRFVPRPLAALKATEAWQAVLTDTTRIDAFGQCEQSP